ncbi:MAG: HEPN domain-containing protein [Anaerolineae bacterium]|nr:HEPN domain-containing protein [Anaerolineae bacterium]
MESRHPEDWLNRASRDLVRVRVLLDADDPEGAGFHLQQALEKGLKAFLLAQGVLPRRTHDLVALLNEAVCYVPDLERFRELCEEATGFYIPQRYPFLFVAPPDREDLEGLLDQAEKLLRMIGAAIGFEASYSRSPEGF